MSTADPWADVDAAADVEALERRIETRVDLPYYAAALDLALSLVQGQPAQVLELGCGSGPVARRLAERLGPTCRILGVDRSRKLIASARSRAAVAGLDGRLAFIAADAAATGLSSARFDLIFVATLLEHVAQPDRVVAELARLLRPGGQVVILAQDYETLILNCPGQPPALTRRLLNAFVDGFASPWAGRAVGGWLAEAGFTGIRLTPSAYVERAVPTAFLDYLALMMRTLTVETGQVEASVLEAWLHSLRSANQAGAFFLNWEFFCWTATRA